MTQSKLTNDDANLEPLESGSYTDHFRMASLQIDLEVMKQERLRNNLRIIGLPSVAFQTPSETIAKINAVLNIDITTSEFTAYSDKNKSSIIVSYVSYSHKRRFMDVLKERKSLLVRDVFPVIDSTEQIYVNDHLTPYFANLFRIAWKAKKDGKLFSVSSLGGKVRIRQRDSDELVTVNSELQLFNFINATRSEDTSAVSTSQSGTSPQTVCQSFAQPSSCDSAIESLAPIHKRNTVTKSKQSERPNKRPSETSNDQSETKTELTKKNRRSTGFS